MNNSKENKMLWRVFARTNRTDWVELNAFDNEKEARELASEVLNSGGTEVKIECD